VKSAPDQTAIESARDKADYTGASDFVANVIKARLQVGEIVGALDFPEADRPLFWDAISRVLDEMPCVRPTWRTIGEQRVHGLRTRQKMFRIAPHQQGVIDATLAGLVVLAAVCALLLSGWLP
jgi:hypothetical protein